MNGTNSRTAAADLQRRVRMDPRYPELRDRAGTARTVERNAKTEHMRALRHVPFDGTKVAKSVGVLTAAVTERKRAEAALDALWAEHRH